MATEIKNVTAESFQNDVMTASTERPIVVVFWAPSVPESEQFLQQLQTTIQDYAGGTALAVVNVEQEQMLAQSVGLRALPTTLVVKDGQPLDSLEGPQPEPAITQLLDRHISKGPTPLDQARALIEQESYTQALDILQVAWSDEPRSVEIAANILRCLIELHRLDEAQKVLSSLDAGVASDDIIQALAAEIELASAQADLPEVDEMRRQFEADPSPENCKSLALVLNEANRYEEAMQVLLAGIKRDRAATELRPVLLDIFKSCKDKSLVTQYQRQLFTLMY
ncbi:tetratricopeptide repeat protein [Salinibius halmophilus]|uniref:tetratricopeptide repeat protein n=1 Tax=Salinibius halmophilus TaxID=1853216 RepID=UPI000E668E65|nr:tetratricopeptide repeat protein [Salinibius halmophilus]